MSNRMQFVSGFFMLFRDSESQRHREKERKEDYFNHRIHRKNRKGIYNYKLKYVVPRLRGFALMDIDVKDYPQRHRGKRHIQL